MQTKKQTIKPKTYKEDVGLKTISCKDSNLIYLFYKEDRFQNFLGLWDWAGSNTNVCDKSKRLVMLNSPWLKSRVKGTLQYIASSRSIPETGSKPINKLL